MFKKFVERLAKSTSRWEVSEILSEVDMAYQQEKIGWKDHELLFSLAANLTSNN